MTLLAIDTSMKACSVSILDNNGNEYYLYKESKGQHAECLFEMLGQVFKTSGICFSDLSKLVVTSGPGSFTGVRIGLATAKGIALGLDLRLSTFTSLNVISREVIDKLDGKSKKQFQQIAVAVPARHQEVYLQVFDMDGLQLTEAFVSEPKYCKSFFHDKETLFVGPAASLLKEALCENQKYEFGYFDILPNAKYLSRLAHEFSGNEVDVLSPLYLREPDAKVHKVLSN